GIACALLGQDESSLGAFTSDIGGILEAFAAMELARQATWCDQTVDLYHYRTQDQAEVDIVLQNRRQEIIGIEIKAAQSVSNADFGGLRHLQAKVGRRMLAGYVLYLGEQTLPFGEGLRALPLSAIWELG
ncbi:MAG: DUF4143 domain-containing protein, partial [Bifidobacteriaceae bacterium]|nr:DUF4143 domain-containing protein [Bifidobacteriaceae bacterium]